MNTAEVVVTGELLKWTNYVHGWQVRLFKLTSDGYISYSLSKDGNDGSRGSIKINKMILQLHRQSEVRFDIVTPSATWYLRAHNPVDRTRWTSFIESQQLALESTASIDGSIQALTESSLQVVSDMNIKLEELTSFKDSLSTQLAEIRIKLAAESPKLSQQLSTVQATVHGIVSTTSSCIELFHEREQHWQEQIHLEREKSKKLEILYSATNRENSELIQNSIPQGPHLNEDEFYDAIEETLNNMDHLEEKLGQLDTEDQETTTQQISEHRMYRQMQELINKYIALSKQDPENDKSWNVLSKSGVTKIFRKEEEKDGVMVDYLVATTTVQGVTAGEMAEVFHSGELKLKWDHTIEADKMLETLDEHCSVYHQILKRVWPTAQRDVVYASHKQQLQIEGSDHPSWIICNVSCDHPAQPESSSAYTRATIEVVMLCTTISDAPAPTTDVPAPTTDVPAPTTDVPAPTRKDLSCKIVYSASVNPGGWAPQAAVRAVSQREYPKFLKKISEFAINHVKAEPLKF